MAEFLKSIFLETNLSLWSISTVTAKDVLDILIVAYIIYKVLMWISGTRAWSLFKGVVVVFVVSLFSYIFNLYTVSWLVSNTISVGLIAVIVLFQPELRKALEQIGKGKFTTFFSMSDSQEPKVSTATVREVVDAAKRLAAVKTGALILIEKDVPLGDHEQTGIPIDAIVTSQLLINIFENKTPLHDGAVIIRHNRVAAATCILPLTQQEIGRDLGTRHRAAVGASEVSDAYVLVVSEETGTISIAKAGTLHRGLSEKDIWEMINTEQAAMKKKRVLWKGRVSDEKTK